MGSSNVVSLLETQLERASVTITKLARRQGVPYGYWPAVWVKMRAANVDIVEVADHLRRGEVTKIYNRRVPHFDVESADEDSRILLLTIALQLGTGTIEVVAIYLKGEVS